jgi:hypothetical protein
LHREAAKAETGAREIQNFPAPLSMREALRLIWQAASYPILGNGDAQIAVKMDAEALERAGTTVQAPDDEPEFAIWIAALRDTQLPDDEREDILSAIYDVFDPDRA